MVLLVGLLALSFYLLVGATVSFYLLIGVVVLFVARCCRSIYCSVLLFYLLVGVVVGTLPLSDHSMGIVH